MLKSIVTTVLVAGLVLIAAHAGWAQEPAQGAAQPLARGAELIKKGDLEGALEAYGEAARAPDATQEVQQKYIQLRRVVQMRETLNGETDATKWQKTAETLRNSYYSLRLYGELYGLAKAMHERKPTPGTAALMADALLSLNRNEEAEKALSGFERSALSAQAQVLLGLAQGRQKKVEDARSILAGLKLPDQAPPRLICDVARLKVLSGDVEGGMATLTMALKKTSPKGIEAFREFIREAVEFANLPESANFAAVLKTAPGADESACSSGPDCGTCPSKASCPTGQEAKKPEEKKEEKKN